MLLKIQYLYSKKYIFSSTGVATVSCDCVILVLHCRQMSLKTLLTDSGQIYLAMREAVRLSVCPAPQTATLSVIIITV